VLEISEEMFGHPVLYVVCYLPPTGSSFYTRLQTDGISLLEGMLNELRASHPEHQLIVTGDFNARTKDAQDSIPDDSPLHLPLPDDYKEDTFNIKRSSRDLHGEVNEHGKSLLELCCTYGVHFLNGRTPGDMKGDLTCFTANGSS
jgi:hypothetical protein